MRASWKAIFSVAVGALLLMAPVVVAQKAAPDEGGTASASAASKAPATKPAAKPAEAAPEPAAAGKTSADPHIKPGSDYPHWEAFLGYSYVNGRVGPGIDSYNANGGSGSIAYNFTRWIGLVGDFGGYTVGKINGVSVKANEFSYLFGPRLNYRFGDRDRATLFSQILVGGVHGNSALLGGTSANAFAMTAGGGADVGVSKHVAVRLAQLEYFLTNYDFGTGYRPQNNFRLSTGVLFRWGAKPIFVNKPPSATCSAEPSSVMQGSGDVIRVHAGASDPDGDSLTYSWTATGGSVDGTGPDARWTPGNAAPGSYTVTANVSDGHGGTASCSAAVRLDPRPLRPPSMTCSVDRSSVIAGERVNVTATASSPEGFPLTYTWRANGGQVTGSGANVQYDTTGLSPGTYTVTGRVDDGHNGAADCVANVTVNAPPAKPQASKLGECEFKKVASTRVDNVCSRTLDDVALRLQNDPKANVVVVGYADPKQEKKGKVAETRADNVKKYLEKKGISASRVTTQTAAGVAGAEKSNRRAEIIWVPEGATY